ncbi:hypothetical protein PAMP_018515 [Pampus punctatissimus]
MDKVIALLVPSVVAEIVSGYSRVFTGESVRLRCRIADEHRSVWEILWFRGSEQLPQGHMEYLTLWKPNVKQSGKYYCQGVRDTVVGNIRTPLSLPVEIDVDGGWAILQVPPHSGLVGETLKVTCHVRGNPPLQEVILYKDGVEVMRQRGLNPHFYLTSLKLKDQGLYSCRASWDVSRRTHSVISVDTEVQVSEVLTQPGLEIVADNNKLKLICHLQYNARAPAPPIHYYFYKNNNRLGIATSNNYALVKRSPGQYSCKAKVPELGISRWSEPKSFGQGLQMMMPIPLAPQIPVPDISLLPAAEPRTAQASPQQSTATPTFIQPTEEHTQSSDPLLKPPQPAPSALLSTVHHITQTVTPELVDADTSGDFADSV